MAQKNKKNDGKFQVARALKAGRKQYNVVVIEKHLDPSAPW